MSALRRTQEDTTMTKHTLLLAALLGVTLGAPGAARADLGLRSTRRRGQHGHGQPNRQGQSKSMKHAHGQHFAQAEANSNR